MSLKCSSKKPQNYLDNHLIYHTFIDYFFKHLNMKKITILSLVVFIIFLLNLSKLSANDHNIKYTQLNGSEFLLDLSVNDYQLEQVVIAGVSYTKVSSSANVNTKKQGWAELPVFSSSVQLSPDKNVNIEIISSEYTDINLTNPLLPSRGIIYRNQDPSAIPYVIDPASLIDQWYPNELFSSSDPYIIRDVRGINIHFTPFLYNSVQNKLRIYTKIVIKVSENADSPTNPLLNPNKKIVRDMASIYNSMFVNYNQNTERWTNELGEVGDIMVIYTSRDATAIQPWITWKKEKGFKVTELQVATGTNVKTSIQTEYTSNNNLLYVLLVGDWADIKSDLGTSGNAPMDPQLGCVVGGDNYSDLMVGRFSASTAAHVTIQGDKVITYEKTPEIGGTWYSNGLGIGSEEGAGIGDDGEMDQDHMDVIKENKLIPFTYTTVTEAYGAGVPTSTSSNAINGGVSVINYCGHGAHDYWVTSNYAVSNVNSSTNGDKLPYAFSVACVVGEFHVGSDCLAEAMLRKDNGGAVATWMSTINQPWQPPMRGQDYANDILTQGYNYTSGPGNGTNTTYGKTTFGAVTFNAGALMLAESAATDDWETYKTWTIFGDGNLQCRTETPKAIVLSNEVVTAGTFVTTVNVGGSPFEGAIVSLYKSGDPEPYAAVTDAAGTVSITHPLTGTVKLTVTGFNLATYSQDKVVGSSSTLIANFSGTPLTIPEGGTVDFTDLSTPAAGIVSWNWSFPGAVTTTSTVQNPTGIQYNTAGFYNVSLTVSDGTNTQTETKTNYIKVNGALNADFSGTPTTLLGGNTVDFTDLTTGGGTITTWAWTFAGGTPGTSSVQNPTGILYSTPGTYAVTLTVTDDNSVSDTETKTAYITVLDPNALMADFTADYTTIVQGGVVNFFDASLNGPPTTWSWTFNGAATTASTDQNPAAIQYNTIGTFTVSLTVNDGTNTSTEEKVNYITVVDSSFAPEADFIANYTTIMAGTSIDFFDLSSGNPTAWEWTFVGADISASTDQNPTMITYNTIGIYPVTLEIVSAVGGDSLTKLDYIHVIDNSSLGPLEADFHALGSRLVVQGSTVSYEDLTVGYPTNWTWNFEGGIPLTSTIQNPLDILYNTPGLYDVELIVTNGMYSDTIVKTNYIVVSDEIWQDPLGFCDTISNMMNDEIMLSFRHLTPDTWGYFPGHNGYTCKAYAEKYTNYMFSNVQGILIPVVKAYSASSNAKVRFMIWDVDTNGMPGNTLAQKDVQISAFTPYIFHSVLFDNPVDITGEFFAGFNIYYETPQDTFVVYMAPDRGINGLNTMYVKKGTWKTPSQVLDDSLNTSLAIDLIGCLVKVEKLNIEELINIYPNPVSDALYIEVDDEYSDEMSLQVYDIFGREMNIRQENEVFGPVKLILNDVSSGIYFVKINIGDQSVSKKITVIK